MMFNISICNCLNKILNIIIAGVVIGNFISCNCKYNFSDDPDKKNIYLYLMEAVNKRYSLVGDDLCDFYSYVDSLYKNQDTIGIIKISLDSYYQKKSSIEMSKQYDDENIDLVLKNIDESFEFYKSSWNNYLSLEQYGEYVSAYRIDDELLEDWRSFFRIKYAYVLDSLKKTNQVISCEKLCNALNNELKKRNSVIVDAHPYTIGVKPSTLDIMRCGSCKNYCNLGTFVMRSFGLPVAIDGYPGNHYWNVLITDNGLKVFSACELSIPEGHLKKWLDYMEWHNVPRIWRQTFKSNPNSLVWKELKEPIPDYFQNPYIKDVTSEYYKGFDVKIPVLNNIKDRKIVYLSVYNKGLVYLDWSVKDSAVIFKNVSDSIVYFPTYYQKKNDFVSYPFMITAFGKRVDFIPKHDSTQDVVLYRKYSIKAHHNLFLKRAVGAKFQVANNADFSDAITFYSIKDMPKMRFTDVDVSVNGQYKYIRYLAPDSSYCSVAELEFYDNNNNRLEGKIIGIEGSYQGSPKTTKDKAFDGNVLTFFNAPCANGAWVGLEFEKPQNIGKVRYIMRNDGNFIQKDELYELFYADYYGWKSMGVKMAKSDSIIYENVPKNAIYLLKDHSGGVEERIFTYENGKQLWH